MARASSKPAAYSIRSPLEIVTTGQVERAFDLLNRHAMDRATIEFPVACPGRHIVEFEQAGEARATYGKKLLPRLADILSREFGKGFDDRNLRNMRAFYLTFPIWNAVRTELSWTHYRNLLRVSNPQARQWYMNEATTQNWSSRALDRQIDTLYYERLLLSGDKVRAKV